MSKGSLPLAGVLTVSWGLVYLATQVVPDPSLGVGITFLIGIGLTILFTVGYPSALRGPRLARSGRRGRGEAGSEAQPGRTIEVAGRWMPLRSGLTAEAAQRTVKLLHPLMPDCSVAITDREELLAFSGPGAEHHTVGQPPRTLASAKVFDRAKTVVIRSRQHLGCPDPDCPLQTAVGAPLAIGKRVVGALLVCRVDRYPPPKRLVEGLAGILSLHLELAELDRERKLAVDAKLDALRAQINPHFLFNTLNTIASRARTDSEEARQLLLRLSDFFRYAIRQHGQFAEFGQEYFFVRTYLALEQARFGEALRVRYDVDPQVLTARVPVLTIQPLVENAVKHGLADKVDGGTVTLKARVDPLTRTTSIRVSDDGVGIQGDVLDRVRTGDATDGGVGLRNISERLETLYGQRCSLDIRSDEGGGTVVELRIPLG